MRKTHLFAFALAAAITLPGVWLRLAAVPAAAPVTALASGAAILGASFLLLWACDAAQADISQALALAVVALIAVLPEYSVDMYFTWQAGRNAAGDYAHYAIANMTGANRLLIGVAWAAIAGICWLRFRKPVVLESERRTEIAFLGAATLYGFLIPVKGTLAWYDGAVLLGLYGWYLAAAARRCCAETEAEGPAELIARLPGARRRLATTALFLLAGFVILYNAEPFCEGLVATGRLFRINEFLLVQWLAPIASEAPEFTVALVFAWRGQAGLALGSLLSAKLNQWTLLVGMIPGVFAVSHGTLEHPIPMGGFQMAEILLTAAQSLLAVALLAGLRLTGGGALLLFGLFAGQLVLPAAVGGHPLFGLTPDQIHPVFSFLYVVAAAALFAQNPREITSLFRRREDEDAPRTPHCLTCKWRRAGRQAPVRSRAEAAGR
ncbi:MAG: sodium:calcium antiporter [Bryobacteraceae bacterium]